MNLLCPSPSQRHASVLFAYLSAIYGHRLLISRVSPPEIADSGGGDSDSGSINGLSAPGTGIFAPICADLMIWGN
jgi:hypothetical protein